MSRSDDTVQENVVLNNVVKFLDLTFNIAPPRTVAIYENLSRTNPDLYDWVSGRKPFAYLSHPLSGVTDNEGYREPKVADELEALLASNGYGLFRPVQHEVKAGYEDYTIVTDLLLAASSNYLFHYQADACSVGACSELIAANYCLNSSIISVVNDNLSAESVSLFTRSLSHVVVKESEFLDYLNKTLSNLELDNAS